MPRLDFRGRTLVYRSFGAAVRDPDTPTYVVISSEYRDTETLADVYSRFDDRVSGIVLDSTNMGLSSRLDRPLTAEEVLEEVNFACEKLNIRRPVFVGYCSTAELALFCARSVPGSAVMLQSPLMRIGLGNFIDFFYGSMRKPILAGDAFTLAMIMNLVDLHSKGLSEDRHYFLKDQVQTAGNLSEPEHFWIKTLQCKPVGRFDWETMSDLDRPAMVIRGQHDPLQPIARLRAFLSRPEHRLVEVENSHRLLDDMPELVEELMVEFTRSLDRASAHPERAAV